MIRTLPLLATLLLTSAQAPAPIVQPAAPQAPAPSQPQIAPSAPLSGQPGMWKLSDADTNIYLFGTIHVLPQGYKWENDRLAAVFRDAQSLTVETVLDQDPAAVMQVLMALGISPGLPPLADRVVPEKRAALLKLVEQSGLPIAMYDKLETWAAAFLLSGSTLAQLGLRADSGVEPQLLARFRREAKPVDGLETPEQQLGFFDGLPEEAQRQFLDGVVDAPADARKEFDAMLAAWARGDEAAIAKSFDEDMVEAPLLRDVLLKQRNAAWAETLAARLETPGSMLVAVGAGHLAGADSVLALLAAKGLTVERVQ
jgi:uncharacterized protein YbaP (TraB family)